MHRRTFPLIATAFAATALLAGCGGSSSTATVAAPASAAVTPAESPSAAATTADASVAPSVADTSAAPSAMPSMTMATMAGMPTMVMPSASLSASTIATDAQSVEAVVHITDFKFSAPSKPIMAGTMFTVINDDAVAHTYEDVKGAFDSGNIKAKGTVQVKAPKAGTYALKCDYHSYMHGSLTVS